MPDRSDRIEQAYADAAEGTLPYISKSRVKTWINNPEHFRFKYVEGIKPEETDPMVRGSRIHETFERFYEAEVRHGKQVMAKPELYLPADRQLWADFINPYIGNFIWWERQRLRYAQERDAEWAPVAIEEEVWVDPILGMEDEPEWMGLADVVLPAAAFPFTDSDDGVVIVDFKTGSVPDEKYRGEGIYTELEYYTMLFEQEYNVSAAAAFYPREGETVVQPDDPEYRANVEAAVGDMVDMVGSGADHFERREGPLCKWGTDDDEQSAYYGICNCTWGVPANNVERFKKLKDNGLSDIEIAHKMDTSTDAVRYWTYKLM